MIIDYENLSPEEEQQIGLEIESILRVSYSDFRAFEIYDELISALLDEDQYTAFRHAAEGFSKVSDVNQGLSDQIYEFALDHVESPLYSELLELAKAGVLSASTHEGEPLQA